MKAITMFLLVAGAVLAGAAQMESMQTPDSSERITVYHPDGERLLMTHDSSERPNRQVRARPKKMIFPRAPGRIDSSGRPPGPAALPELHRYRLTRKVSVR